MRRSFSFMLAVCLAFGLAMGGARAAQADNLSQPSVRFIADIADSAVSVLSDPDLDAGRRADRLEALFTEAFAVDAMASAVTGRYWRRADEEARTRFRAVYPRFLIASSLSRIGDADQPRFEILRVTEVDSDRLVETRVDAGLAAPVTLQFRVVETAKGPRILDVGVEGIGLILAQSREFAGLLRQVGVDGLAEMMERKLAGSRQVAAR